MSKAPRHDVVDENVVLRKLGGERAGESKRAHFGGANMGPVRPAFEGIETRDIDDAPPSPFNHARYYRLGGEEWSVEVHGEHAAPLLNRHVCYGVDSAQSRHC